MRQFKVVLSQLHIEHLGDLYELFQACGLHERRAWKFDPEQTIVALVDDRVVGVIFYWLNKHHYGFVDGLLVHPDYRGGNVGPTLCRSVATIFKIRGVGMRVLLHPSKLTKVLEAHGFQHQGCIDVLDGSM